MTRPRLAEIAHRHGARLAVDGAQLVPHRHVDLCAVGADYLALSGHKMYAPFGAGALIGRRDWLDAAPAHLAGGGAVREVTTDSVRWAPAPARVAAYLSAEHGIGVRDGKFCAHPLLARLGAADGAVRVSLGLGSQASDIDRLVVTLSRLRAEGPSWSYTADHRPSPDTRPLPDWARADLAHGTAGFLGPTCA